MKLIKELLEAQLSKIMGEIAYVLEQDGYYIDELSNDNLLIVYRNNEEIEEDDWCVEIELYSGHGSKESIIDIATGTPQGNKIDHERFDGPFSSDVIDDIVDSVYRRFQDHPRRKIKFSDLHADDDVKDELKKLERRR